MLYGSNLLFNLLENLLHCNSYLTVKQFIQVSVIEVFEWQMQMIKKVSLHTNIIAECLQGSCGYQFYNQIFGIDYWGYRAHGLDDQIDTNCKISYFPKLVGNWLLKYFDWLLTVVIINPTNLHESTSQAMKMCVPATIFTFVVMTWLRAFISPKIVTHKSCDTLVMLSVLVHVRLASKTIGTVVSCTMIVGSTLKRIWECLSNGNSTSCRVSVIRMWATHLLSW